jgi:diacylglycerol kinase (ATP)
MKPKLIVNLTAANGAVAKRWPLIQQILRDEIFAYDFAFTERKGHAIELARSAVDAGCDLIVAVGGDGTLNEVVNGMIAGGKAINSNAQLGFITSGTGADFVRTLGLPRDSLASARHLAQSNRSRAIDLGEILYRAEEKEAQRYFANVVGMGFDGEVIERTERGGKHAGGTIPYLTALVTTVFSYKNKDVTLQIDGQTIQGRMNSVIACNGQYFGGGMRVGPHATLDDGKLDVIVLGDFGVLEVLSNTPKIYNGTHLTHHKVSEYRGTTIQVESKQRMLIEADGELLGAGPATFRVIPAALRVRC